MEKGLENRLLQEPDRDEPITTKRIEIVNDPDDLSPPEIFDYSDEGLFLDTDSAAGLVEAELSYTPFDPAAALKNIRQFSPTEQNLTNEEKRRLQQERLINFKEQLLDQKEGIARTIAALHQAVATSPNASTNDLFAIVKDSASAYKFSRVQLAFFKDALQQYQAKHAAVEKYRALYPDDDLFAACFGKKPAGQIEVVKGPMTLYFRCYDSYDYAFINSFSKHGGDESKLDREDITRAANSAGVALRQVKIEALTGVVTAENIPNNNPYFEYVARAPRVKEIHGTTFHLFVAAQKGDIDIDVKGVGVWQIRTIEHQESGEPLRLQCLNLNEPDSPPVFDVIRVTDAPQKTSPRSPLAGVTGALRNVTDNTLSFSTTAELSAGGRTHASIDLNNAYLGIQDHSSAGTVIKYREDKLVLISNEQEAERTRVHEDQHQFNKLFEPIEMREDIWTMMRRAVARTKTSADATQQIIHGFVQLERKWLGLDTRARDEILAHYQEGQSPAMIHRSLAESELYNYAEQYQAQIAAIPARVKADMKKYARLVTYNESKPNADPAGIAQPLEVDETQIQPHLEQVFRDEYKADLVRWIDSISALEQKGYSKPEITALLYQAPVNSWPNLSRRLKPKNLN